MDKLRWVFVTLSVIVVSGCTSLPVVSVGSTVTVVTTERSWSGELVSAKGDWIVLRTLDGSDAPNNDIVIKMDKVVAVIHANPHYKSN